VNETFEVGQQLRHLLGRRRDEYGVAGPAAADPVLRTTQFAWLLAGAACAMEQYLVGVTNQACAQGQTVDIAQIVADHAKCTHEIRDFFDIVAIVQLNARFLVEQVGQARLRAFDLGGQQGFFAHGAIEQPFE
jgi:hypothetical protein